MRIGVLTFHASHNFGSMLQNYALQQFLISEGHIVETINLRNERQKYMYNNPLRLGRTNPYFRTVLGRFRDPVWLFGEYKKWILFERFLKENLILTKEYCDWKSIKEDLPSKNYDVIIVGSDQIWNPFCYDFDWSYFLPDNIKPIKKIAFSPSFGNRIPDIRQDSSLASKLKDYLIDFDCISVRELDASIFLQEFLHRSVQVTADPTIIAPSSSYFKLINTPIIKDPYIYYYTPSHAPDIEAEEIAIKLAQKLGLNIVTSYPMFMKKTPMKRAISGPAEFLNLLYNAQVVIGKSYHLVLFSILFHKSFITVKRKNEARIDTLLNQLKITGRNMDSIDDFYNLTGIDYNIVDRELEMYRQKTICVLREALKGNN